MSNTKRFRTKQMINNRVHPKGKSFIVGLDVGYSGTKVFYEGGFLCFPSYAKKIEGMLGVFDQNDIIYREDETGDMYMVGYNAQNMMESSNTNDTEGELFARNRYSNKMFRILCNTAIGLAQQYKRPNQKIVVQTGLPSSYVSRDTTALQKAISAGGSFSLKVGNQNWVKCMVNVKPEDVYVMPQPAGALYSVLIKNDGNYIGEAKKMLLSNILVIDIGFGTFDFYGIKNREVVCTDSIDDIGMKEVLRRTSKKIMKEYGEEVRIGSMQKNLVSGTVTCINEDDMTTEEKQIGPLLFASSEEVMQDALIKAKNVTNAFRDYNYIIVDGGTGEAWYENIKDWLKNMKTIKILPCNINDTSLPFIFANARGYYMFRYMQDRRG